MSLHSSFNMYVFSVSKIAFENVIYMHPKSKMYRKAHGHLSIDDAISDSVDGHAKPLSAVVNGNHVVTFTKIEDGKYVFKNSLGNINPIIQIPQDKPPARTD